MSHNAMADSLMDEISNFVEENTEAEILDEFLRDTMNILFVCSQNKRRSLTAEKIFDGVNGHSVRSAGTEKNSRVKVTPGLIGWADMIFCFEKKHLRRLREKYSEEIDGKSVVTLNIPDDFEYMDEELQDILRSYVEEYL